MVFSAKHRLLAECGKKGKQKIINTNSLLAGKKDRLYPHHVFVVCSIRHFQVGLCLGQNKSSSLQVLFLCKSSSFSYERFARRLVLRPRHKVSQKWPIGPILVTPKRNVLWNSTLERRSSPANKKGDLVIIFRHQTDWGLSLRWVEQPNNSRLFVYDCITLQIAFTYLGGSETQNSSYLL